MSGATKLTLIRHGRTLWNDEKRAQGHTNNGLNELGFRQAARAARRLGSVRWDRVYSSDLLRAKQTAEIIAQAAGIAEIRYDNRLRELHGGRIEGTTLEERIAAWGDNWKELDLGVESPEEGAKRGASCLREIAERHPGETLLVVSHGAVLRHTIKHLVNGLDTEPLLGNTSVTELIYEHGTWSCPLYNCTAHLDNEERG
ncbi:histidine phosphatase family protein [Cohnella thailandensis]|uniref:Histidine phosphatase family protein n=1 Tax=Cohnella thailandensis TaxID=557557 RepID=A0A841SXA5_9BACL|nr:histidine phosphatase family protein [Cohnella thailandensis]MBB6635266.1 histidine phosphatase family protein [Cohnella thailandensis]MBP1974640.1 putative phosphoglycerate mutase [Cohnella thailandensis]